MIVNEFEDKIHYSCESTPWEVITVTILRETQLKHYKFSFL